MISLPIDPELESRLTDLASAAGLSLEEEARRAHAEGLQREFDRRRASAAWAPPTDSSEVAARSNREPWEQFWVEADQIRALFAGRSFGNSVALIREERDE